MRAFEIENSREFMNSLFTKGSYDDFLVLEADISAAVDIHMNGRINTGFYDEDTAPKTEYIRYGDVREKLLALIKGDRPPLAVKLVLFHPAADNAVIEGGCINIIFSSGKAKVTSAVSRKTFSMDRTDEKSWDEYVEKLLLLTADFS
ncbi:MAG: DUF5721 family protein [Lachnospiraceae bacterium]|nr:DUF5721 family protein [Lachnospiraceae bacterium]